MKVLKIGRSSARHAITLIRGFSKAHNNNGEQRARNYRRMVAGRGALPGVTAPLPSLALASFTDSRRYTTDPACHATMAHCISRGVAEKDAVAPSVHSIRTLRQTFKCGRRRRKRCGDRQPSKSSNDKTLHDWPSM